MKVAVIKEFRGIHKGFESQRYFYGKGAEGWLTSCQNFYIDANGMLKVRNGYTKVADGEFHSPYEFNNKLYIVKDNQLGILKEDLSFRSIYSPIYGRLSYAEAGEFLYATEGISLIRIESEIAFTPRPELPNDNYGYMPAGQAIANWQNRLCIAKGNTIYISEPMNFEVYHKPSGWFLCEGYITMLAGVQDGLYFSDSSGTYFLTGVWTDSVSLKKITPAQALGFCKVPKRHIPSGVDISNPIIILTKEGFYLAGNSGNAVNLTPKRFPFDDINSAYLYFITKEEVMDRQTIVTPQVLAFY